MRRDRTKKALMMVTALVWAAALTASISRFKLAAKPPLTVSLLTDPRSVRIALNGHKLFDGAYTETPQTLSMPPGRHRLKIERDGYVGHVIKVEGESGDHYKLEDVVLQKTAVAVAVLRLESPQGSAPVYFELDDGFIKGETPYESEAELLVGTEHVLTAFPKWPKKDKSARCKFTIAESQAPAGHLIKLRLGKGGGIRFSGCERIQSERIQGKRKSSGAAGR